MLTFSFIRIRINHILLFLFTIKWVTTKKRSKVWRSRPRLTLEIMNTTRMDTSIMDTSIMDTITMDTIIMDTIMDTSIIMNNLKRLSQLTLPFRFIISVIFTLTWSVSSLPTLSQMLRHFFFFNSFFSYVDCIKNTQPVLINTTTNYYALCLKSVVSLNLQKSPTE